MASSGKKPGIKDISDLKARLGLTPSKPAMQPAQQEPAAAPAGAPPAGSPPAGSPPAGAAPAGAPPAGAPPAGAVPAGAPPSGAAPAGGVPAGAPPAAASPAPQPAAPQPAPPRPAAQPAAAPFGQAANPFGSKQQQAPQPAAPAPAPAPDEETYDYEPPEVPEGPDFDPGQFDPTIKQPISPMKIIALVGAGLILLVGGFFGGSTWQGISRDRASVNTRIELAGKVLGDIEPKVTAFKKAFEPFGILEKDKGAMAPAMDYNEKYFKALEKAAKADFVLTNIPPEAIILAENSQQNPLPELRNFASGTTLLKNLIDSHVKATKADMDEINDILGGKDGGTGLFAIKFSGEEYQKFLFEPPATEKGPNLFRSGGVYKVKGPIPGDQVPEKWKELKEKRGKFDPYKGGEAPAPPEKAEGEEGEEDPADFPPKLILELQTRGGEAAYGVADELLILDQKELYGSSGTAVDRYRKRMATILEVMWTTHQPADRLLEKLKAQSEEEKL